MKKAKKTAAFLFVVVLLMSSVAFAGQNYEVSANDVEIVQTADHEINQARWISIQKEYTSGTIPDHIVYNSGGYTGILYFQSAEIFTDKVIATFAGWVKSGVDPASCGDYQY